MNSNSQSAQLIRETTAKADVSPHTSKKYLQWIEKAKDFMFAVPALIFLGVFLYYPLMNSVYISFTNWNMTKPVKKFVGTDNYVKLFKNEDLYQSLKVTLHYTLLDVVLTLTIGLLLALLFNVFRSKMYAVMRGIIFMPHYISMVIAAMVFTWIYNGQYGLLNRVTDLMGFEPIQWLTNPSTALPALVAVSVWKGVGFAMMLFISGMRGIPNEYYEAAAIDGASGLSRFRYITLPLLSPMTLFLVITTFISSMQVFQSIDIMTNGGPLQATNAIVYWIYTMAFTEFKTGRASALVMILFVIILVLTIIQWLVSRKQVHYEG
ncbi:sugar ABC transporter permease [Paenibacillus motobuensis]|uniref:carbohydrate ABC transporter permease n=1 Tax=Paenibacillus TaxID=44249 RepID=UPI00203D1DD0|nr:MULTISPECIES: sugar ABC transporter permease [Paenibacillus]MCM3042524.1 sugar ABC transporter permease [Paenibacillus lutimineralis]MCM3649628.1 sugar ABC transporter permease [Paenibacillus motobuensis]